MHVEFDLRTVADPQPTVLVVGNLDGVHRGHRQLLSTAAAAAAERDAGVAVVTFDPHPRCVVRPDDCPASLSTLDEKRGLLEAAGVNELRVVNFTHAVSQWSAEEFCERILAAFAVKEWVMGPGFAVGHQRRGDLGFLRSFGQTHGFDVTEVHAVDEDAQAISSSRIRMALQDGDIAGANRMLGYDYFIEAIVEHGNHVGGQLGFPTANLAMTPNKCLPQRGVYSGLAQLGRDTHMAAINVGYRPTFGGTRLIVEAYLLDFSGDIYDAPIRLSFRERLREERYYATTEELVAQMHQDVAATRTLLA